ncbi:MAG: sarcosine oxidase subunit gamma family protein, partial [Alphaproteobacteria bacterium]
KRSPLAFMTSALAEAEVPDAVALRELSPRTHIDLRGEVADPAFAGTVESALRLTLPRTPNRVAEAGGLLALWLGPDEWLLVGPEASDLEARLRSALSGQHVAITDVSANRTVLELGGPKAREVLNKGCPLDLDPRVFGPGQCAQSILARAQLLLHQRDIEPTYHLYVRGSFAFYAASWLIDAMKEYRFAKRGGRRER